MIHMQHPDPSLFADRNDIACIICKEFIPFECMIWYYDEMKRLCTETDIECVVCVSPCWSSCLAPSADEVQATVPPSILLFSSFHYTIQMLSSALHLGLVPVLCTSFTVLPLSYSIQNHNRYVYVHVSFPVRAQCCSSCFGLLAPPFAKSPMIVST